MLSKLKRYNNIKYLYGKTFYGIKTALNEAFISDQKSFGNYFFLKKILEGKDIKKWTTPNNDRIVIVFEKGSTKRKLGDISEVDALYKMTGLYPDIFKHLINFQLKAKKRYDQGDYWWELRNCAYYSLFEKPKIIFPNLQNNNKFAWDESKTYINAPAVFLPTEV